MTSRRVRVVMCVVAAGALRLAAACSTLPVSPGTDGSVSDGPIVTTCPAPAITAGHACNDKGLVCPYPGSGGCGTFVCDGTKFVAHFDVQPGASCSTKGLFCTWTNTECGTCTCDGTTFHCDSGCCSCFDAGPVGCPLPAEVVDGQSCSGPLTCESSYACDAGSTGACTCGSGAGTWACQCLSNVVTLALDTTPWAIAIDGTSVYWTSYLGGTIKKVPIGGGATVTLASNQSRPLAIAVAPANVYWANFGNPADVSKVSINGGTPIAVGPGLAYPGLVAVDGNNAYWGSSGDGIQTQPLAGGTTTTLALVSGALYGIALDSTSVYWTTLNEVTKVALDGGPTTSLATGSEIMGVAVDSTSVYWADYGAGTVMKRDLSSASVVTLASGQGEPNGIAIDGANVYWTSEMDGTVMRISKNGGTPALVAFGQSAPMGIAVDATNVYWANFGGSVAMAAK